MNVIYLLNIFANLLRSTQEFISFGWCKSTFLLLSIIYFLPVKVTPSLAEQNKLTYKHNSLQGSYYQADRWLASNDNPSCQEYNSAYVPIYSFETENYYINICQLNSNYYYYRQSKLDRENSLLIPAQAVFGGNVFQAIDSKTTYLVGKDGDRYYSSVMLNNNEIVFEPEFSPEPLVFSTELLERGVDFSFSPIGAMESYQIGDRRWKLNLAESHSAKDKAFVCTQDKAAYDPHFDGWRNLLGKTTEAANSYASDRGYSFSYETDARDRALIQTNEGTVVNLNITATSQTIDRVCVNP